MILKSAYTIIGCVSILLITTFASCQKVSYENIEITKGMQNSTRHGVCEPSIAINTQNTDEIVAGSIINKYHFSRDGGKTWNSKELQRLIDLAKFIIFIWLITRNLRGLIALFVKLLRVFWRIFPMEHFPNQMALKRKTNIGLL